jgi:hypothetical protein
MEDIHSSDAEALPRWVKRATTCAFNEEFGKSMREVGSGGMAAQTIRNFKILRPMCPRSHRYGLLTSKPESS